jgi:hypothetical protein
VIGVGGFGTFFPAGLLTACAVLGLSVRYRAQRQCCFGGEGRPFRCGGPLWQGCGACRLVESPTVGWPRLGGEVGGCGRRCGGGVVRAGVGQCCCGDGL